MTIEHRYWNDEKAKKNTVVVLGKSVDFTLKNHSFLFCNIYSSMTIDRYIVRKTKLIFDYCC